MASQTGTLLIPTDIGVGWGRQQADKLAVELQSRLEQPVSLCFPSNRAATPSLNLSSLVNEGIQRLVVVPFGLLPISESSAIFDEIADAKRASQHLDILLARPLIWLDWSDWLRATTVDVLAERNISPAEAGVLIIGSGTMHPMVDANLPRIAHLVQHSSPFPRVTHGFLGDVRPTLVDSIRSIANAGLRHIVVVPWLIDDQKLTRVQDVVRREVQQHDLQLTFVTPNLSHPKLIDVLVSHHQSAASASLPDTRMKPTSTANATGLSTSSSEEATNIAITPEERRELDELDLRLNDLLPPEYQGTYEAVQPTSMGTAGLKYDGDGKVAWDEIWTSFCDLALAGGPPHRGTLLEAVTSAEALAEPDQYKSVVNEIERGIRMVTGLPLITSRIPGWVGVICQSEEMAVWLMRAIIVENVMVRREGNILYLPAGPKFTLKREIKNVITAIAKTVHYWTAHLKSQRQAT